MFTVTVSPPTGDPGPPFVLPCLTRERAEVVFRDLCETARRHANPLVRVEPDGTHVFEDGDNPGALFTVSLAGPK